MTEFMNWTELADAHRKLKADHEALRALVDQMAETIENHIHQTVGIFTKPNYTTKPLDLKRPLPTPQPTPSPTSEQTRGQAAPAEGAR